MGFLHDDVMDGGLQVLTDDIDSLHFCTSEPIDYADALANSVGNKASPTVSAPQFRAGFSAPPDGRMVLIDAVAGITPTGSGVISHWAVLDTIGSRLLATNNVVLPTQVNIDDDDITASSFEIGIPTPAPS